ncbi:MAG TPA: hypothetical protein PL033_13065 [Candidatus Brocadiia bacterium]|nr:hypothetical protein [Candidatus Brocadiia bacterium]
MTGTGTGQIACHGYASEKGYFCQALGGWISVVAVDVDADANGDGEMDSQVDEALEASPEIAPGLTVDGGGPNNDNDVVDSEEEFAGMRRLTVAHAYGFEASDMASVGVTMRLTASGGGTVRIFGWAADEPGAWGDLVMLAEPGEDLELARGRELYVQGDIVIKSEH